MENFFKDFKLTFLLTVVICLLALIPVIGPILIVGGISIFFIYAVLNSVFEDRETPKVKKRSEPLFDSDQPDRLTDYEPSSIEIDENLQVKDLVEIVLSPKKKRY